MKFMPIVLLFCVTAVADEAAIPKSKFSESGHTEDSLADVKSRVESKKAILLDVREVDEWEEGHLKHAKPLPLSVLKKGKLTEAMQKSLVKDKPNYLHCAAGGRVLAVEKLLRDKGYDIRPLKLGYDDLIKKGFEKAPEKKDEK